MRKQHRMIHALLAAALAALVYFNLKSAGAPTDSGGFRVITNTGADAGQTVMHFHMHVLGGCDLGENLI